MRKIDINTGLKISIIFGVLTVSFSIVYYFLFLLPSRERMSKEDYLNWKAKEALEGYKLNLESMQKREEPRNDRGYSDNNSETQITREQLELQQQQLAIQEAQRQQQLQGIARIVDKISKGYEQEREKAQQEYQQGINAIFEQQKRDMEERKGYNTDCRSDSFGNVHCTTKRGF